MSSGTGSSVSQQDPKRGTRAVLLTSIVLVGFAMFAWTANQHYPIQHWLFWRYLRVWLATGIFGAACLLIGGFWVRVLGLVLPRFERTVIAFAFGVYSYFLAMFVGGCEKLYGPHFATALPLLLGGVGAWNQRRRLRRLWPFLRRIVNTPIRIHSPVSLMVAAFGVVGLALVYLPILTPNNASADARWYHLSLAEHYVAAGGIARFPEGATVGAFPQLATLLYTWAFMLPRTTLFDRVEIAAHLEFLLFVVTLLAIGVLSARMIGRRRIGVTWAAVFLFPGIFLYDSNLSLGADHVLAFWAPVIFLVLLRVWKRLDRNHCLALAILLAGACLTKYQAGCLVVPVLFAVTIRAVHLGSLPDCAARGVVRRALWAICLLLALTAPHWAKNAYWYGDPLFPLLHKYFPARPWGNEATEYFNTVFSYNFWLPEGSLLERLRETALAMVAFSFKPHTWEGFHGDVPVFGSLFTLTSLCIPFLPRARRLWGLLACTYGALLVWYLGSHFDRYLQAILPWMAAATAALIERLLASGSLVRVATCTLVGLQVVWGSDIPFIPTHVILHAPPYKAVIDLFSSGYKKGYAERLRPFGAWPIIGEHLPQSARVLVHDDLGPLGLGRMTVTDMVGWQSGIIYRRHPTERSLYDFFKTLGVTHVIWRPGPQPAWASIADDIVFYTFATLDTAQAWSLGGYHVGILPAVPPPMKSPGLVLLWGTVEGYRPGLYPVANLSVIGFGTHPNSEYPAPSVAASRDETSLVGRASFLVTDGDVSKKNNIAGFTVIGERNGLQIWARVRVP